MTTLGSAYGWVPERTSYSRHELSQDAPCAVVVEDEILIRWSIADVLRGPSFAVYEFATADDATFGCRPAGRSGANG